MDKQLLIKLFEWALRCNIFLKLLNYGFGKMIGQQFYTPANIPANIAAISLGETTGYNLAWTFFGYSQGYILFIGISQIVGALLFLIPRTKLLGALILIPILLNIIVVDIFFGVAYGALFSAVFYLLGVLWVLYQNKNSLRAAIELLLFRSKQKFTMKWPIKLVIAVAFLAIIFGLEVVGIQFFGYTDR